MTNDPIVSVIICVYNGALHLEETLDSVIRQSGIEGQNSPTDIEVILIDDFSSDRSPDVIRLYKSKLEDRGFVVQAIFHPENLSIPKSYTEGVRLSRGKYFKMLDQDDILVSNRALAEPIAFMETMGKRGISVGAVFSKTLYMDAAGTVFGEKRFPFPFLPWEARDGVIPRLWGQFVLIFSPLYPFVHGASLVRKECWEELSVEQMKRYGSGLFDVLLALHVMHSQKWHVAYLREPGLKYRIHSTNYTQAAVKRGVYVDVLRVQFEQLYGQGVFLELIMLWTRLIQELKSVYHRIKGQNAFKSIAIFGRRSN